MGSISAKTERTHPKKGKTKWHHPEWSKGSRKSEVTDPVDTLREDIGKEDPPEPHECPVNDLAP